MLSIPFPRALPLTIVVMAALLAIKVLTLAGIIPAEGPVPAPLLGAGVTMVGIANAASPPADAAEPAAAAPPAPRMPSAPEKSAGEKPAGEKLAGEKPGPEMAGSEKPAGEKPAPEKAAAVAGKPPAPVPPAPVLPTALPSDPPPVTDGERAVLLDLRSRRQELDARENGLGTREKMLAAAEQRLNTRIDELTALQTRLEALDKARKEREEANWRGLVKIYEDMKPRDAATIFNGLDMSVLLEVLDRMKEGRTAPILAAMQTDKARQATADLAQKRLKNNSIGG